MPDVRIIPASGSLQFTGSSAADSIHVQYTNSGLNFTNSASLMYISSSGNVGIGTSTPGAQFEIKNTTGGIPTPTITLTTATYNTSIIAGNASYPYALGANSFNIYHAVAGPIGFYNGSASPTLRFSILSDGKVIIGNATSATSQFTVNSLINGTGIELKCSTTANTCYAITHTTAGANTWALNSAGNASSQTAGTLSIGSTTNNILFFSNGNTVLGASNSSDAGFKLDVNGTARFTGARVGSLSLNSGDIGTTGTGIYSTGTDGTVVAGISRGGMQISNYASSTVSLLNSDNPRKVLRIIGGFSDGNTTGLTGNTLDVMPTYNFTGTQSPSTIRGFYYNPTLTSMVGVTHRAIETVTGDVVFASTSGNVGIGKSTPNAKLDVSGSAIITGSLTVTGGITGSITSASFASTASFVNTLNQSVIVTSSMVIGSSSLGPSENTLTLGARDAGGEGGQLGLNASGGTYTSASMLDNYQNQFRILRGSNAGSDALVASWNMHTKQMQIPAYNSVSAFAGTAAANLAVDSSGNVITVSTSGGTVFPYTGNAVFTGSLTTTGIIYAQPNGGMYFQGGDDAALYDINVVNTMGIYGVQDATVGSIKLGSGGGTISGKSGNIGIGTINPTSASFQVNGNVWATSFTGSHFGTSSYATQALSASWAPGGGGSSFPYTGSARITGSLNVIGDTVMTGSLIVSNSLDTSNRNLYTPLNNTALDWSDDTILNSNVYQRDFKSTTTQNTVSNTINNAYVSYLGDIIEVDGTYTFIDSGVTDGMLVYLDTDATWYPVSQSSTTATKMIGIAFNVTGGGLNTGFVLLEGHVVINVTLVQSPDHGLPVYIRDNTTTGEMSTVVPTTTGGTQVIRVLGHCYWNNIGDPTQWMMKFRPSNDWILI